MYLVIRCTRRLSLGPVCTRPQATVSSYTLTVMIPFQNRVGPYASAVPCAQLGVGPKADGTLCLPAPVSPAVGCHAKTTSDSTTDPTGTLAPWYDTPPRARGPPDDPALQKGRRPGVRTCSTACPTAAEQTAAPFVPFPSQWPANTLHQDHHICTLHSCPQLPAAHDTRASRIATFAPTYRTRAPPEPNSITPHRRKLHPLPALRDASSAPPRGKAPACSALAAARLARLALDVLAVQQQLGALDPIRPRVRHHGGAAQEQLEQRAAQRGAADAQLGLGLGGAGRPEQP